MPPAPIAYEPFRGPTWRNPYPIYARLRQDDPVHHASKLGIWVLTRFADVHRAALDGTTFSSSRGLTFQDEHELLDLLPTIVMMDPPEHTTYRRLVSRGFTPKAVRDLESEIRSFVRPRLDELCDQGTGDLVAGLAEPLPSMVVARCLGVPGPDRARFARWTRNIVQGGGVGSGGDAAGALAEMYGYFAKLVAHRRQDPGDDLISTLLQSPGPEDGGTPVSTERVLGYAFVMVAGGNDTVTGLIGGMAQLLDQHRDQRRLLLDDPSLVPGAIEELLRMTSPVQGLCRVTTTTVRLGEVELASGSRVLLCYGSANRDPDEFGPTADQLDVTRTVKRQLTFSSGVHYCLGAHLARLQGRVVLEELLTRCPEFAVDAEAGTFADGPFVRRYESLPFLAHGS